MWFGHSLSLSLRSAARYPRRAFLAALSIGVGIAVLVIIVSGERSWQRALDRWYRLRGVDIIHVRTSFSGRIAPNLPKTVDETQRFLRSCPSFSSATPVALGWRLVKRGRQGDTCSVRGVLPGFERVFGTRLLRGRFLTDADESDRGSVCLLDVGLSRVVFGKEDMVGKEIRVGGHRMRVIGIADDLSQGGLAAAEGARGGEIFMFRASCEAFERRQAGLVVPLSTARRSLGLTVDRLAARAADHRSAFRQIGRYFDANPWAKQEETWVFSDAEKKQAAVNERRRMQFFVGLAVLLVVRPRSAFTIHGLGRDPLARGRTSALPRGRRGKL